ncbi:MAG TPA: hypothetical protein VJX10_12035 [Pseudonocardiaceae bacterium]|nr:hypothetical protein [Pseudonocardiaceae bacterium]
MPDAVFLALKARATGSGRPLSEFLRELLEAAVAAPAAVVAPRTPDGPVVARD